MSLDKIFLSKRYTTSRVTSSQICRHQPLDVDLKRSDFIMRNQGLSKSQRERNRRRAQGADSSQGAEEDDTEIEAEKPATVSNRTTKSSTAASSATATSNQEASAVPPEDDRVWVQCNTCDKWRSLPNTVDPASLPDIWFCELNMYDAERNCCEAPEESYNEGTDEPLKSFLKLWTKKLKTADKAETRQSSSAVTRGRKRRSEVEWIRCCSASCGKWRAVVRTIDTQQMLSRLSPKNKWGSSGLRWYCSMNSWDETQASCASPQESLFDCRWNLGGGGGLLGNGKNGDEHMGSSSQSNSVAAASPR